MASSKHVLWGLGYTPSTTPAFANHTVDATNDAIGFAFQARDNNPITHVGFRFGSRTGATTLTLTATLEGIAAATGNPDGSDIGGGSPTAVNFNLPNDGSWDGTFQWIALTNSYTPTRGQTLCFTIRTADADIGGANFGTFTTDLPTVTSGTSFWGFPQALRLTAGSWSKRNTFPIFGVRTASSRYGNPIQNIFTTRSDSTAGHRQALKFSRPAGSGDTFKVAGLRITGSIAGATGKNPILGIWDASNALQTLTLDTDFTAFASTNYMNYDFYFDEANLAELSYGTTYYAGLEVADAVNGGVIINGIQLAASADSDAFAGGSECLLSTYNGSAWSDDATVRPLVDLILADETEPASGGGAVIFPTGQGLVY